MKLKIDDRALLTLSSGLLAGMGATISFVGVPSILAAKEAAPVWKVVYSRGKNIALVTIATSTITSLRCYYKTEDFGYLLVTLLTASFIPWTVFFMAPTNKIIYEAATEDKGKPGATDERTVRQLVKKWDKLQYVRTALGIGAFLTTVAIACKKK